MTLEKICLMNLATPQAACYARDRHDRTALRAVGIAAPPSVEPERN